MVVTSGVQPLEVDPIVGILQEVSIRVSKNICALSKVAVDDMWVIPHGFQLPFSHLIIGLVINEDKISLTEGERVNMGVKM